MDWINLIMGIAGIVASVDLFRLIFIKEDRRKHRAEAEAVEKQNKDIEIETMRKAIDSVTAQNDALTSQNKDLIEQQNNSLATIKEKDAIIEEKNRIIDDRNSIITALFDDMCVHKGCRLRKPHQGRGQQWYEQYKDDPALGCDFLSIDTLIKQDRAARLAANILAKEGAAEQDSATEE